GPGRVFEGNGGTIGRDEGNTLPLPDPLRRVSRLHATISFPAGVPTLTNSSTVLPIGVGGAQLESGQSVPLVPGMNLSIGTYVLVVRASELPTRSGSASIDPSVSSPVRKALVEPVARAASPPAPSHAAAVPIVPASPIGSMNATPQLTGVAPLSAGGDPFADLLVGLGPSPSAPSVAAPAAPVPPVDDPLAALLGSSAPASSLIAARSAPAALDPFTSASAPPPIASAPAPVAADPFAALLAGSASGAAPAGQLPPGPLPVYARPADVIPEDFNPFELPSASARNSADPLSSMLGGSGAPAAHALTQGEESIDALFAPAGASRSDDLLGDPSAGGGVFAGVSGAPPSLLAQPASSDPLALFGDPSAGQDNAMRPMRDDVAEIGGAYQPPRALDAALAFAPPPAAPFAKPPASPLSAVSGRADSSQPAAFPPAVAMPSYPADALTRAFLAGANLPPGALPNGLTPELMTIVGSLLRSATSGAIEMLAIRANIKREVQASVTIISSEANNPLKFLLDADSVLTQFLGKKMRGFMTPDEAMRDAFRDLSAHELGVIAGTRAALGEVLTKFDPAILGERLIRGSFLEKALPAMRKTKLWDLYLERYAQMRREVEDDFQSIFGKAFVAAYEQESARMKGGAVGRRS
ncbi:MAG: type VI secretion system-associated FHA domain protein TagH, partial [Ramlibacter sp.]